MFCLRRSGVWVLLLFFLVAESSNAADICVPGVNAHGYDAAVAMLQSNLVLHLMDKQAVQETVRQHEIGDEFVLEDGPGGLSSEVGPMKAIYAELHNDYNLTIALAPPPGPEWKEKVVLFTVWDDLSTISTKHIMSVKSAYFTQVEGRNDSRTIYIWTLKDWDDYDPNIIELKRYAQIKRFEVEAETSNLTPADPALKNQYFKDSNKSMQFLSDDIRYILLYKYGGLWFDLDVFFVRSFDPLFVEWQNDCFVYAWQEMHLPNGAVYWCPVPRHPALRTTINTLISKGMGMGFREARLRFESPSGLVVLPCSWFDASWLANPLNFTYFDFFRASDRIWDQHNFFPGIFAYHWHNQWGRRVSDNSPAAQLMAELEQRSRGNSAGVSELLQSSPCATFGGQAALECDRNDVLSSLDNFHSAVMSASWANDLDLVYRVPFWQDEMTKLATLVEPYLHEPAVVSKFALVQEMTDALHHCHAQNIEDQPKLCGEAYLKLLSKHPDF